MRALLMSMALASAVTVAAAQQPVYLCDGTYTDRPCKGGKEVDIAPTRGAHSMSGTKRESHEAVVERITNDIRTSQQRGMQKAHDNMRCDQLRRRREAIDRAGRSEALDGERLRIREQQFALKCRRS